MAPTGDLRRSHRGLSGLGDDVRLRRQGPPRLLDGPLPQWSPGNTFRVFDSLGRLTREASGNVDASGTIDSSPPSYGARVSSFAYDDLGHLLQRGDGCTSLADSPSPSLSLAASSLTSGTLLGVTYLR